MVPHRVDIGERYSDDSGWARLVSLDRATQRVTLTIGANHDMRIDLLELDWLIAALTEARRLAITPLFSGKDGAT